MQIIGFNLNKISAFKSENFKPGAINTNIEFIDIEKEKIDLLKDSESIKILFKFSLEYSESQEKKDKKLAEIVFDGAVRIALPKETLNEIMKSWKKKKLPPEFRVFLFNVILRRTASKCLILQDELMIPSHIPIQQVRLQPNEVKQ